MKDIIESLQQNSRIYQPAEAFSARAHIPNSQTYKELYARSLNDSHNFWLEQAQNLSWEVAPTKSLQYTWDPSRGMVQHSWFEDGQINVSKNCLDRHLNSPLADQTAIVWQGEAISHVVKLSYRELHGLVCRFANVLVEKGIQKGDRVCIYLPMIPETVVAMLACARVGAIHSVVFGGFSSASLASRIQDLSARLLITADEGLRGGKNIPLKSIADEAVSQSPSIEQVIVVKRTGSPVTMCRGRDYWWHEAMETAKQVNEAAVMKAEDPLFILYTSGSTGKPKGVLHTQAGYLLHAALTFKYIFDYQPGDVYWCTADVGWITGHSYIVYGPLACGATILMYEGIPSYPDSGRFWELVQKYRVNIFYTAPTAIRALMREGSAWPEKYDLSSLRLLGTVGEPINPEAWEWYYKNIGGGRCPIVDTWWQTETGGILMTTLPGAHAMKPGAAGHPFFGVDPVILREDGLPCGPNEGGNFCLTRPWPGIMRTTWGDHQRFIQTYFSHFKNIYCAEDVCKQDQDGYYWFMGRADDVVNVSGHRIGTAEVESALVSDEKVAEAAVVSLPHPIKGEGLYAFVVLKAGVLPTGVLPTIDLAHQLKDHVAKEIGPIAKPELIQIAAGLPKTRSGKIMRRILKKIAVEKYDDLGDITTLADPLVVEELIKNRSSAC